MQTATIEDVQARLPEILDQLTGEDQVLITRDGRTIGALTLPKGVPIAGRCKGMLTINAEDDEHLKDFAEYMP